ncbi:MAG: hypothetical protein IM652_11305 [Phenylobacterium sp.]|nr:hypothetical protein [Phenylobacterium sp.]
MRRSVGLVILVILSGGPALAQQPPPSGTLDLLLSCRSVRADADRLACFDRASASLAEAEAGGALVVMDRAKVEAVRRQAFVFSIPSIADLMPRGRSGPGSGPGSEAGSGPESDQALRQVEAGVVAARLGRDGKWVLSLDNGSVWRQTDTESVLRPPRAGSRVVIKSAAMGSFLLSVDGQRSIRVRREE